MGKFFNFSSYTVIGWMVNELQLSGTELVVYAIIYGYSQDGQSKYTGSLSDLVEFTGTSTSTIRRALKKLVEKNYLIKHERYVNNVKRVDYSANLKIFR